MAYLRCAIAFLLVLSACDLASDEVLVDRAVRAGPYVVREHIVRRETLHDPIVMHRYTARFSGRQVELGGYTDESEDGMHQPPAVVAGRLVVMSSAHVFAFDPTTSTTLHVCPWEAKGWERLAYCDVDATHVAIDGSSWTIGYERSTSAAPECPPKATFISRDGGGTFALASPEVEPTR